MIIYIDILRHFIFYTFSIYLIVDYDIHSIIDYFLAWFHTTIIF